MYKVTFECETITPMFLAGADGRTPELRAPSIKGALRFWWRAMNGHLSLKELRRREGEIFGGTGEKEGKSSFSIIVNQKRSENITGNHLKRDYRLNWRFHRGRLDGPNAGIGYLLYATMLKDSERAFFYSKGNSHQSFTFSMSFLSKEKEKLQQVIAALWGLVFLGGLGLRSRRGGGNIAVKNVNDENKLIQSMGLSFILNEQNQTKIREWLIKNFNVAKSIINEEKATTFISDYSNVSFSRIIISKQSSNGWIDALSEIGKKYEDFRFHNRSAIFETGAFGLPVVHRSSRLTVIGRLNREPVKRRPSPLIFKVLRSGNGYYWMVIRMAGEFLPPGGVIEAKRTRKPDYRLIDEFWNSLKNHGEEFILSVPDTLKEHIEALKKELSPSKIILFGSRARGDFHSNADIDIAIETTEFIEKHDITGALDIVDLKIANESLKKVIQREGVSLL